MRPEFSYFKLMNFKAAVTHKYCLNSRLQQMFLGKLTQIQLFFSFSEPFYAVRLYLSPPLALSLSCLKTTFGQSR